MGNCGILITDDEERIRLLIKKYAEFEGYEVVEASDGMEAVQIIDNGEGIPEDKFLI